MEVLEIQLHNSVMFQGTTKTAIRSVDCPMVLKDDKFWLHHRGFVYGVPMSAVKLFKLKKPDEPDGKKPSGRVL